MLDFLRRKAQSTLIQATVIIIAVVFIFWGVGTNNRSGANYAAEVNGEPITFQEYQRAYDQVITQYRSQFGGTIPEELFKSLGLKEQVLDQLINAALLRQGAAEAGLLVSNQEIGETIQGMEAFKLNGAFNMDQYKTVLSQSRMSPAVFEASLRHDLLNGRLRDSFSRIAKGSPSASRALFLYENEKRNFLYGAVLADSFRSESTPTDEELAAYYETNKERYKTEAKIKLKYLFFDQAAAPEITEEQVSRFYEENLQRFTRQEQRSARHILIRTGAGDTPEQIEEKRARAQALAERARTGEDFSAMAKKESEDGSASQGGDLGFFGRGMMVPPFEEVVFGMKEGEVSDVVLTDFGFHVIKLEKIEPEAVTPLAEAAAGIRDTLVKEEGRRAGFQRASEAYEQIILAGSLEKYSEASGAQLQESDFFSRREPGAGLADPTLANDPAFVTAVFALKKGELSSLIELASGYAIALAADLVEPATAPFDEVRSQVKEELVAEKSEELARKTADELLAELRAAQAAGNDDFAAALKARGVEVRESGFVGRSGEFMENSQEPLPPALLDAGFRLTEAAPYPETVAAGTAGLYVFRLKEKQVPDEAAFAGQEEELRQQVQAAEEAALLQAWVQFLRSRAEIRINENF